MISIAWLTALRLFVSIWTRALHLSTRLSPASWDRVVIVCVCLLIVSVLWLLSATPSAKMETPVELSNTQQRPELERPQQLQDVAQRSTSDPVLKASYSDRSNSKRTGKRASTNRHKPNYVISEARHGVTVQVRAVPSASVKPSELNVTGGKSGTEIAAEAALKEKVQTTPAETANNTPLVSDPTLDEIKAPLEQFEPQIELVSAKAEVDAATLDSLPRYYSAAYIRAKAYVEEPLSTPEEPAMYVDSEDSGVKPVYQPRPTQPPLWIKKSWPSMQYSFTEKLEDTDTDGVPDSNSAKDDTGAQTWDIFDNESNFDVRDVTSGSCMAFASVLFARSRSIEISPDANKNTIHAGPTEHGITTDKPSSEALEIQPRGQQQRSTAPTAFAALAAPGDLPQPVVPTGDKNAIFFWMFLLNMLMNTLSTTSAIILAWISNNRAKAELVLKEAQARRDEAQARRQEAEALREAKEKDLKIKELEIRLAEAERSANRALIIVSS